MDIEEFQKCGKEMVDYICEYLSTIQERRVHPSVEPGYMRTLVPNVPPEEGEEWAEIMKDIERVVMPGITHWQHPGFHAYFPAGNSFPSIMGDMLGDAIGCVGFSWSASPACAELEGIVLDWFAKMIGLPADFCFDGPHSSGGGVIQGSASDSILIAMLCARTKAIRSIKQTNPENEDGSSINKMVAYFSKQAHSAMEKAAMIACIQIRQLSTDSDFSLRGDTLQDAIKKDLQDGFIPIFVGATLGTTSSCAFDNLAEIGIVCKNQDIWLHVDAAYAGSSFICPENRHHLAGVEFVDSINVNPNKFLLVNFDCTCMWVKRISAITEAFNVDPIYLRHKNAGRCIDYRHWGIPLSRRFRALKLWFVIRSYGVSGLQAYIRNHCQLAKQFESLVKADQRFELVGAVHLGLVCFRLKGPNKATERLLSFLNDTGKIHMVPSSLDGKYVIRFCVCKETATELEIQRSWSMIQETATITIQQKPNQMEELQSPPGVGDVVASNGLKLMELPIIPAISDFLVSIEEGAPYCSQAELVRGHFKSLSYLKRTQSMFQ